MSRKLVLAGLLTALLGLCLVSSLSTTVVASSGTCSKVGLQRTVNGSKQSCQKSGSKLLWTTVASTKKPSGLRTTSTTTSTTISDYVSPRDLINYGLSGGNLTRLSSSGIAYETDSRKPEAFSAIRQRAFRELALKSSDYSHPNIEFNYVIRPSFPKELVEHSRVELQRAAALWSPVFESKTVINVFLVTEADREFIKGNRWLQLNLPKDFDRFDRKAERSYITGGGGYGNPDGEWSGNIYLATASYFDTRYASSGWPQVARHEFFHVVQDYVTYKSRRSLLKDSAEFRLLQPNHFREGGANTVSYLTAFRHIGWSSDAIAELVWRRQDQFRDWIDVRSTEDVIRMMRATEHREPTAAFEMAYAIGAVMYEWLIGTYGIEGLMKLLSQMATANSFEEALQNSVGLTQSDFYSKAAPYVLAVFNSTR